MRTVHCSGCLPRGVSVPRRGGLPRRVYTSPYGENSWHTLVKTLPFATTVVDGNHKVLTIRVKEVLTTCNEKSSEETSENGRFYEKVLQVYDVWIGTALHHQASTHFTDPKLCR